MILLDRVSASADLGYKSHIHPCDNAVETDFDIASETLIFIYMKVPLADYVQFLFLRIVVFV